MKKILIDLNIVLDFLNKREGHEKAAQVINLSAAKKIKGYICAHEITTLSYFLSKDKKDKKKRITILNGIMNILEVINIDEGILKQALTSEIDDYEDAVIEMSAKEKSIDYIITRNLKDFKKSSVSVLPPGEFLNIV
jgi:predicted nucleic acid-binding protein